MRKWYKLSETLSCSRSSWTWPFPPLPFSSLWEMDKAPQALGMLCLAQDGGIAASPPKPLKPSCCTAGSAVLPSCGCAGNSFPFVWPSDPICSATAQIQFRRRVPPASSWALSLRNHSNPPRQRPSNLNKPSDISMAGQDAEQDSPHARFFETL